MRAVIAVARNCQQPTGFEQFLGHLSIGGGLAVSAGFLIGGIVVIAWLRVLYS